MQMECKRLWDLEEYGEWTIVREAYVIGDGGLAV